jgi:hypothetical protein
MIRLTLIALALAGLAACAQSPRGERIIPGANHSLATSSCTNGDPDLRQAKLGCPN